MLIKAPSTKWARDEGLSELIDHFDAPERYQKWDRLTSAELRVIEQESDRCRKDFSYASRNYFWIQDKKTRQDMLFRLFESQQLLYEVICDLKARGRSQRIMVIKARQLGASTLAEGMIAWRTIFFRNVNSLIVSYSPEHAAYLFSITQHMYDKLPWWLRPECASREFKTGLILDNPDPDDRRLNPGLNSKIMVNWANAMTGVGQGIRLSAAHISEFCDFVDAKARDIIEEDVLNALDDGPETFAMLESTPKGAGRYAHGLWIEMEKLGDKAMWTPVFLPWFFDKSHRRTVDMGWKPRREEEEMRDKIARDWLRCTNTLCRQYQRRNVYGRDFTDTSCPTCSGAGTLKIFNISDEQLAWMEFRRENAKNDEESLQKLVQEQATTAEESFVQSGVKLFSDAAMAFVSKTTRPPLAEGMIDKSVKFHGVNFATGRCWMEGCLADHTYDENGGLSIFEWPQPGSQYVIGADVSEGIGKDYSVASVIRVNPHGGADAQVAIYARNDIDTVSYAEVLNRLGRFYNEALIAVEVNKYDTTETFLRLNLGYPNCYISKNVNSENVITKRFGWVTTGGPSGGGTKPRLYQTLRKRLDMKLLFIRDKFTVSEISTFRKDEESGKTGAAKGMHDDRIIATMIAEYVAHELDWDESSGIIHIKVPLTLDTAPWIFHCKGCDLIWPAASTQEYDQCPKCRCMWVEAKSTVETGAVIGGSPAEDFDPLDEDDLAACLPSYDEL